MQRRFVLAFAVLAAFLGFSAAAHAEVVLLRSALNGGYVGDAGGGTLLAGYHGGRAIQFERIPLQGSQVAFRAPDGRFVRAGVGAHTGLAIASPHIRDWETFQQVPARQGMVAFMSMQNFRFVTLAADGRTLVATDDRITDRSLFRIEPVQPVRGRPAQQGNNNQQGRQPAANTIRELTGYWNVEQVLDPRGRLVRPHLPARRMEFFVDRAGSLNATGGCRRIRGVVRAESQNVRVSDITVSRHNCSNDPDAFFVEEQLRDGVRDARRWEMSRGKLHLKAANGQSLIVLSRR